MSYGNTLNLTQLQNKLKDSIRAAAREAFQVDLEQVTSEVPPRIELGDLAFPVAFELARLIKQTTGEKKPPRAIAETLKSTLDTMTEVGRVDVAGAGYLNVFFNRVALLNTLAFVSAPSGTVDAGTGLVGEAPQTRKLMVEHTSINPNKAAHIGHVRNAVLGDTYVNILRAAGDRVEVQNYIDNTGVQVADVVVGFMYVERLSLEEIKELDLALPVETPFDFYCWDLYKRVGDFYLDGGTEQNPEKLKLRVEVLHAIEAGDNDIAELADYVATRNVEQILDTMERLGIRYDLLARESEILHLRFWERAFELMKERGVIHYQADGRNRGCWVMPFESHSGTDEHESDKIIVRSNKTVTYTGKDIAYQLWKLGQLGLDFNYQPFRGFEDGHTTWITTTEPSSVAHPEVPRPNFGGGAIVYNVIDSRQSYPQEIVKRGVAAIVPEMGESASVHLSYEMVALSPAACEDLEIELSDEDRKRPYIEMSGRKGLGVKADDLIDRLQMDAFDEVEERHPDLSQEEKEDTARAIANGALRYFLLKFTRNTVIAFDFKEALSFEGETGPYCQYAAVRANSIFRKLDENALADATQLIKDRAPEVPGVFAGEAGDDIWSLLMLGGRLEDANAQAAASAEPAFLAKYTFSLAKAFNLFYHRHRIIAEENPVKRAVLTLVADFTRRQLTAALATLGIEVPERM